MKYLLVLFLLTGLLAGCSATRTADLEERAQASDEQMLTMAGHYERAMELEKALIYYLKALENTPDDINLLYQIADLNKRLGKNDFALQMLKRVLVLDPAHSKALTEAGLIFLENKQLTEASTHLLQATVEDQERLGNASSLSRHYVALDNDSPLLAYNGLAVTYDLMGKYEQAREVYALCLQSFPRNPVVLTNFGYSEYLSGNYEAAVQRFREAIDSTPAYKRAWTNLGLVYTRMGRYNKAYQTLNQVMSDAQAYNDLGYFLMLEKRYEEAEHFFERAINLSPRFYEVANANLEDVRQQLALMRDEAEFLSN
ncbi:tetratricopeptide repeat protein [Alteromonas ponticola]|uniref:Tetratricopeptide repeat protein n=1 Tax=Alteromonas aquimaris TaxID=2998417 RepID=A0ABT3PB91_9ALTE|nr:tetratricopeptide repeat protein [Alteromonas aquimaris]MCW8109351.1 tetratricopeptide repeat protein [Alteromonas aquimaris]